MNNNASSIPVLDLAQWKNPSNQIRKKLLHELQLACQELGAFYLKNHPVSPQLIQTLFEQSQQFFALPLAEKQKLHFSQQHFHRGYIGLEEESTDPLYGKDYKEAYDFGYLLEEAPSRQFAQRACGKNLYPLSMPQLRPCIDTYMNEMLLLSQQFFEVTAHALELPPHSFRSKINQPIAQLRLLHYPPQMQSELMQQEAIGIGRHCDYECLTILALDENGGLEIEDFQGQWIEAPPKKDYLLIIVGELLTRWTNGRFRAAPHRVNRSLRARQGRYSIPFFFACNYDTVVDSKELLPHPPHPSLLTRYRGRIFTGAHPKRLRRPSPVNK